MKTTMKLCLLLIAGLLLNNRSAFAQKDKSAFKVVGYYSLRSAMAADLGTVPFDKLTHINLSFLNPDTLGNFTMDLSPLAGFIKAAHENNVKVLPSIAGG